MPKDPEGEWEWPAEEHQALHYAFLTGEERHFLPNHGYPEPALCDECDERLAGRCDGRFREECHSAREDARFSRERLENERIRQGG